MKLLVLSILAGAIVTGLLGHGRNADLDAYATKLQGAKSLTVTFRLANDGPPAPAKLEYSSPNKLRIETADTLTISDGTNLTVYNKAANTYTVDGATTKPGMDDTVYAWKGFFTNKPFADATDVVAGPSRVINGGVTVNTYKITLDKGRSATLFLDPARGISFGAQVTKGDHTIQALASSVIVGDSPLSDSEFAFSPPAGAKKVEKPIAAAASYASVQALLTQYCVGCHGTDVKKSGLDLSNYDAVMAGSRGGPVVVAGDPGSSKLIKFISGATPRMPPGGADPVPADGVKTISDWITAGAKNS